MGDEIIIYVFFDEIQYVLLRDLPSLYGISDESGHARRAVRPGG